jgi:hypothetical protein
MIRLLLISLICLYASAALAESITVIVPDDPTQYIEESTSQLFGIPEQVDRPILPNGDTVEIHLTNPNMDLYENVLEDMQKLVIQAGSDFHFPMQYRLGSDPYPFEGGFWPTAELRSAKSPAGVVLATYTLTVDDEAQVKWSFKLTSAQTAALSGKTGYTEIKFPYPVGVYLIFVRIPTEIKARVTL